MMILVYMYIFEDKNHNFEVVSSDDSRFTLN